MEKLYKVLLVDDEEEIRYGMIHKFNWKKSGFEIAGDAENGQDAIEKAERIKPDVVITDIKMPFINGLELCQNLYENMPEVKLVIFSGFDDFEYAKQAIKLNVIEYISKPIDSHELVSVLKKIKELLDKEANERYNVEILREYYIKSLPVLREQFLVGLIERGSSLKWINEQMKQYNIDLSARFWTVCVIKIDNIQNIEKELVPLSVKRIVDENVARKYRFKSFIYMDDIIVIAMFNEKSQINSFVDMMNIICKILKKFFDFVFTAGIGYTCYDITKLFYSYRSARNALDYRILVGAGKSIYIEDVEPNSSSVFNYDEQYEYDLINAIKLDTNENIQKSAHRLVDKLRQETLSFNQYQILIMEIVIELAKLSRGYGINMDEVFGSNFDCYKYVMTFSSLDEVSNWLSDISIKINALIRCERYNSVRIIVEKAKKYIDENYHTPEISVEILSEHLHISPAYFSTIFKRETGINFVTYITNVRMNEALNLLKTTEDKTYIISEKVGYLDPNYFSYVFKKHFGISPSKYRGNIL